jgi:hypothetical protein
MDKPIDVLYALLDRVMILIQVIIIVIIKRSN